MKKSFKPKNLLSWTAVILLASTLMIGCQCNGNKAANSTTDSTSTMGIQQQDSVTDSLPPLDTSKTNTTRPEQIKNPPTTN